MEGEKEKPVVFVQMGCWTDFFMGKIVVLRYKNNLHDTAVSCLNIVIVLFFFSPLFDRVSSSLLYSQIPVSPAKVAQAHSKSYW